MGSVLNASTVSMRISKDCLLGLSLLFAALTMPASCSDEGGGPSDFRGIAWGTNISELKGMIPIESREGIEACARKDDPLKIESATVRSVNYLFYKSRFSGVLIEFEGLDNLNKIKEIYNQQYGKPHHVDKVNEQYQWNWPGQVMIVIRFSKTKGKGTLSYVYTPLLFHRK